jgi:hypothetical protein
MKQLLIILLCIFTLNGLSQVVNEETKKKFTIGLDVFTDIWQDTPPPTELETGTINPGVNIFGTYNYMFGESNVSLSPGFGLGIHNMFNKSFIETTDESSEFVLITDSIDDSYSFKKSKLVVTYLDIPIELRYKSKGGFRLAAGFKFGFLIHSHTKYKGDDFLGETNDLVKYKKGKIKFLETNRYGVIARIGYKWLNLWGYYQLSTLFEKGNGPEMYPISIGITLIPF